MIHILFSSSAAGTLRQVLAARGRRERVIDVNSDLDWGPIAKDGLSGRANWLNRNAPWDEGDWDWIDGSVRKFKSLVESDSDRLIWIAPRSASEQCGLYWYLDQFPDDTASMIAADYPLFDGWRGLPPLSLGELGTDQIGSLLDSAERKAIDSRRFSESRWSELVEERSMLRIVDDGVLKSVSENSFDNFILARCSGDWRKLFRVIGETMGYACEFHRLDSVFLSWRLRVLAAQGAIQTTGEITAFPQTGVGTIYVRCATIPETVC